MYYRSIHFSLLNALLTVSEVMYWINPVEGWWKLINNVVVGCCIFIYFVEGSYQICVVHMHTHLKTIGVLFSAALFNLYVKAFFQQALQRPDWWLYELWFQLVAVAGARRVWFLALRHPREEPELLRWRRFSPLKLFLNS